MGNVVNTMLITLLSCLLWESSLCGDWLTHTSLQLIPVTLGQDVEIRCVKVLKTNKLKLVGKYTSYENLYKVYEDDVKYAYCYDKAETCGHRWYRDGKELLQNDSNYQINRHITYGYCDNFNTTRDMLYSIPMLLQVVDNTTNDDNTTSDSGYCLNSILLVRDVQTSDLGTYSCNFSDWSHNSSYRDRNQVGVDPIRNISLVKLSEFNGQPQNLQFSERYYIYPILSVLYLDCVVTGGPVYWFLELNYNVYSDAEDSKTKIMKLEEADTWHCFNYTLRTTSPMSDVTESVIFLENICTVDHVRVYCTIYENGSIYNNTALSSTTGMLSDVYEEYNGRYMFGSIGGSLSYVCGPLLAILVTGALIVACNRGKCCGAELVGDQTLRTAV